MIRWCSVSRVSARPCPTTLIRSSRPSLGGGTCLRPSCPTRKRTSDRRPSVRVVRRSRFAGRRTASTLPSRASGRVCPWSVLPPGPPTLSTTGRAPPGLGFGLSSPTVSVSFAMMVEALVCPIATSPTFRSQRTSVIWRRLSMPCICAVTPSCHIGRSRNRYCSRRSQSRTCVENGASRGLCAWP
jgi:hypothetical protein